MEFLQRPQQEMLVQEMIRSNGANQLSAPDMYQIDYNNASQQVLDRMHEVRLNFTAIVQCCKNIKFSNDLSLYSSQFQIFRRILFLLTISKQQFQVLFLSYIV